MAEDCRLPRPTTLLTVVAPLYDPDEDQAYPERGRPVQVLQERTGLRIVLDAQDTLDEPNLLIERQPQGWLLLIHPNGDDLVCAVKIQSGRTTVSSEEGGELLCQEYPDDITRVPLLAAPVAGAAVGPADAAPGAAAADPRYPL